MIVKQRTNPFINFSGPSKKLFERIFKDIEEEFNLYCKYFPKTDLFEYNERALIGFFISSIIRNSKDEHFIAIQEYCVNDKKDETTIRPDFLLLDTETDIYYLFEVKQNYSNNTSKCDDKYTRDYLNTVLEQAKKYYNAEKPFYVNKTVYIIAMAFDSVKIINSASAINYVAEKYNSEIENHFYTSYYLENNNDRVLDLYGIIEEIKGKVILKRENQ